jgi:hypothetical protein
MENMEPMDLGNGYRLLIQWSGKDPIQFRAVVKDASGEIISRGSVVPRDRLAESRTQAINGYVDIVLKPKDQNPDADFYDEDEEDEEDEDEEDEEDY